jgi:hypothetical protein
MTDDIFECSFYFVSGIICQITFDEEELEKIIKRLKTEWNDMNIVGKNYGINMSHVTHYELKIVDKKND